MDLTVQNQSKEEIKEAKYVPPPDELVHAYARCIAMRVALPSDGSTPDVNRVASEFANFLRLMGRLEAKNLQSHPESI